MATKNISILQDKKVKAAIRQIIVRAEREIQKTVIDSYYDCNIIEHLKNKNHQIIQGRRGTGKTHILRVLQNELENEHTHCFFFDCYETGSAGEISDEKLPVNHRAIRLMRDFLMALYSDLNYYFRDMLCTHPESNEIELLLTHLYMESYFNVDIPHTYEHTQNCNTKMEQNDEENEEISFFDPTFSLKRATHKKRENGVGSEYKTSGITYNKVVFPNIYQCLNKLSEITEIEFVIFIDEWSSVPMSVQPHFGEFVRRCFVPSSNITVKIASVETRSNFAIRNNNIVYGLEVGADIKVDIELDSLYAFDNNPKVKIMNLYSILWKHLQAKKVLQADIDVSALLNMLFPDFYTAALLARASEGNPRDFISILNNCIMIMDKTENPMGFITSPVVFQAVNRWYKSDKYQALDSNQRNLLSEIISYVVEEKENRGFILKEDYLQSVSISALVDARVLHVLQTGRWFRNLSNSLMAILILDFGTYSQELQANKAIHFIQHDYCEKLIFSQWEVSQYDSILYPLDEQRNFRVCFLDPKLTDICPSFSG